MEKSLVSASMNQPAAPKAQLVLGRFLVHRLVASPLPQVANDTRGARRHSAPIGADRSFSSVDTLPLWFPRVAFRSRPRVAAFFRAKTQREKCRKKGILCRPEECWVGGDE